MFDFEKLYEPYTYGNHTLKATIDWLKKTTKADDEIVDQVVLNTMGELAEGKEFPLPCFCGCERTQPNAHIDHYMLKQVFILMSKVRESKLIILQDMEKKRLEAKQRLLVNSEKQLLEAYYGTWVERNLPTFVKFKRWISGS